MKKLPDEFLKLMKDLLNEEYESFIKTYEEHRFLGLRANPQKISKEQLKALLPFKTEDIPWCEDGLYFEEGEKPGKHPYYHAGLYYIQEPSAMAPVEYLEVEDGMNVLDLCAAPGGKSIQIAVKLNGTGTLVANDISEKRIKAVLKNMELYGIANGIILNDSPEKIYNFFGEYFDRVLIDVPCSGEGMFRKDEMLINTYEESMKQVPKLQKEILDYAGKMLKPGGVMIYSTCTFNKEENEEQILEFLKANEDIGLVDIQKDYGFAEGFGVKEAVRLFPHKLRGEGHFLCKLVKKGELRPERKKIEDKVAPKAYRNFEKEALNISLKGNFVEVKEKLFLETEDFKGRKGIKFVRNGLYLGEIKNEKFLPSQAFIMWLKYKDVKLKINLEAQDPRVVKYLKGETIFVDSKESGIIFISVDEHLLGYGKLSNGTVKNAYNKNWRIQ